MGVKKGKNSTPPSPEITKAAGAIWLMEFIKGGKRIKRIAREAGHEPRTVVKYMKQAAALLIDKVHEDIITEVLPEALALYKAVLKQQIKKAEAGETVDLSAANRLLIGMFVLDSPQLKDVQVEKAGEEGEALVTSLETYTRRTHKQVKASQAAGMITEGAIDGEVASDSSRTDGRNPLQVTDGTPSDKEGEVSGKH